MNQRIHNKQINKILLKPRFKIACDESVEIIMEKFKKAFDSSNCDYCNKIVDHHIVIDVPKKEDHFWSPQLHLEVEEDENNTTVIKGLFGPKPQIWTFFMFIHFAVAVTFIVFFVVAYVNWSLKQDFSLALAMCISMPIFWVVLYVLGQLGKKKGYQQMIELDNFVKKILEK
jgi:ABC-type multidrug transport system fused ATPase/permease subunit